MVLLLWDMDHQADTAMDLAGTTIDLTLSTFTCMVHHTTKNPTTMTGTSMCTATVLLTMSTMVMDTLTMDLAVDTLIVDLIGTVMDMDHTGTMGMDHTLEFSCYSRDIAR